MSKNIDTQTADTTSDQIFVTDESSNQIPDKSFCAYSGECSTRSDLHDFLPYAKENNGMCVLGKMSPRAQLRNVLAMTKKPKLGDTLYLEKCRIKNGELQLLLSCDTANTSKYTCWINSSEFKNHASLCKSILADPKIQITGSFKNFCFHCIP